MGSAGVDNSKLYAGIVWVASGVALTVYGLMSYVNTSIPGIEELIRFLRNIDGNYIYLAAFISIFIEGLYVIGNFFPGSSLVLLLSVMARASGWFVFLITISLIFISWSMAGLVNIFLARVYRSKVIRKGQTETYDIKDHILTSWFPSFRSSCEVAQIVEGASVSKVFASSLYVKFWASLLMAAVSLLLSSFFDLDQVTAREGYVSIMVIAVISLIVGVVKIRDYYLATKNEPVEIK